MQLAHAGDDGLAGVDIGMHVEGRIFLRQLGQGHAHLLLVGFGLRLDRNLDDRLGEVDRLKNNRVLIAADRVAGDEVLQADSGADVTCENLGNLFTLICMHLQQATNALRLAACADSEPSRRS